MDFSWSMQSITNRILRSAVETLMLNGRRSRLGYVNSAVSAGGDNWSFLEKSSNDDTKPVVVFVHGFSSEKDSWLNVAAHVTSARVLIPDLPGHGLTSPMSPSDNFGAMQQVRNLKSFLDATVGPDTPVHLVGCSMGGLISGVFAATYPEKLHSLTLVCPAGISMPRKSPVLRMYEDEGVNIMRGGTVDELVDMIKYTSHQPAGAVIEAPTGMRRIFFSLIASYRAERMPVIEKILTDMMRDQTALEENLHRIRAKTVLLWGENDKILDVSCLERVQGKLKADTIVVPQCGHLVQHTVPELCASVINRLVEETSPVPSEELASNVSLA
ncbi:hypothetical protein AeMF1_016892 [Aphanomyces euteiches]|nr:hypothetical protein AeMF1_016892 [Aphanomyces euteiches]